MNPGPFPEPQSDETRQPGSTHLAYRADIDGLRAVAVLAVVAYHAHAPWLPGGFAGVDVFFVISGFLITSILLEGLARGTFSAAEFYARRIRRLAPSLVAVLAAAYAFGSRTLITEAFAQLGRHIASSAVFVTNFVLWSETDYFDVAAQQKPLLHLWSLGVEEQFYLLWPALLWVAWRWRGALTAMLAIAVLSFTANVALVDRAPAMAFYWPTTRVWELALGGILAYAAMADGARAGLRVPAALHWLTPPSTPGGRLACSIAGTLALALGFALLNADGAFPGWGALVPTVGAALLIAAGPATWINRVLLSHPAMVAVGLISYPLYLWHWPILTFARLVRGPLSGPATAALVALAFALASLSYWLLERPVRRARWKWTAPALAGATAIIAGFGLVASQTGGVPGPLPPAVQALLDFSYRYEPVYRERTCYLMPDQPTTALAPECIETEPANRPLVLLWGDSHAAHLYPGLRQLQATVPFRLAQITGSRCPPLLDIETPTQPHCQEANQMALTRIAALRPTVVIMAGRWRLYDLSYLDRSVAAARRAFGRAPLLVGPVPTWTERLPQVLFNYYRQHPSETIPRRTGSGLVDYVWAFDREVRGRAKAAGAQYVSAMDVFCTRRGCLTMAGDGPQDLTAWDESHLTAAGSEYLIAHVKDRLLPPARRAR